MFLQAEHPWLGERKVWPRRTEREREEKEEGIQGVWIKPMERKEEHDNVKPRG